MPSSGVQKCADRKSTRLNSSHTIISYAVFCLKKKKIITCRRNCTILTYTRCAISAVLAPQRVSGVVRLSGGTCGGVSCVLFFFFFFNDPATTEIYTLSLHDALPI